MEMKKEKNKEKLVPRHITHLSRVSGEEHSQICAFILGIIIGIPLPHDGASTQVTCAV
jgi:hypothetical protein